MLLIIGILILIMAGCSNIKQVNSPPDSPTNSQQNSPKNDANEMNSVLPASKTFIKIIKALILKSHLIMGHG